MIDGSPAEMQFVENRVRIDGRCVPVVAAAETAL